VAERGAGERYFVAFGYGAVEHGEEEELRMGVGDCKGHGENRGYSRGSLSLSERQDEANVSEHPTRFPGTDIQLMLSTRSHRGI
jgi:hypothetical protein